MAKINRSLLSAGISTEESFSSATRNPVCLHPGIESSTTTLQVVFAR